MISRYRDVGLQAKELNILMKNVEDRIVNVSMLSNSLSSDSCIPLKANGVSSIIRAETQRALHEIENKIKLALYPRRKTNHARTPEEVYRNKLEYSTQMKYSFLKEDAKVYPTWSDLTDEQKDLYDNQEINYSGGTIDWDYLTKYQKERFSSMIIYVPNKVDDEEKLDGKGKTYIKLYEREVIKLYKLRLEIIDPRHIGLPFFIRSFSDSEIILYRSEGGVVLFPHHGIYNGMMYGGMGRSYAYGMNIPSYPQVIRVDYSFGLEEIPHDLADAVAMKAAINSFSRINLAYTQGLMNLSIEGFSVAFGNGMYENVIKSYEERIQNILAAYYPPPLMVGWGN